MKQIAKNFLKAFKQIGEETIEKAGEESGKVVENVITGKALLGDITQMSDSQLKSEKQKFKTNDEAELAQLRGQINGEEKTQKEPGRNVESEMEEVRRKQEEEKRKEEQFLENVRIQREREKAEMEAAGGAEPEGRQARGKMNGGGKKKKKSQPDMQQMSQTQEVKGKID